ncbi:MAG TPA: hypothetical protein VN903_19020 [Polyangia bacterium]|jgi:hypothetical protein|nr:hypothetical protein [Polyangia bacterium]
MTRRNLLRKAVRIAGYAGVGLLVLVVVIAIGAPICFHGARFGWLVESALPETRGHTHVGSGKWSWSTVFALLRGEPAALELDDLTITDPEATEVLHIDHLSARIELHRKPTRIVIHDLEIKDARWRFARMKKENKVGFLAAFEGVPKAARKKPSKPATSTTFSIEGARLDGVEATFDLPTWGLNLRDVHALGELAVKDKTFTFAVTDADVRAGGRLRILGEKTGVILPIERGRIDRVATLAGDPDNIHLDASGVVTGRSRTSGGGVFTGIYGISPASKHQGIDFDVHVENAADAANAIVANRGMAGRVHVGGNGADLRLRFTQPFDRIAVDARARGFDVSGHDLEARDVGFHVAAEPMAGRFHVDHLSLASPEGGRLEAEASVDRLRIDATVTCTRFAARALLPSPLRPFAGKSLDGMLHARANLRDGDAELVRSTLVLTRGEGEKGPQAVALLAGPSTRAPPGATVVRLGGARLADGVLRVPRIALGMWGGTFAAEGRIALWDTDAHRWLSPPRLDLKLQGSGIQIERLIGSNLAAGALSFRAQARGPANDLTLEIEFVDTGGVTVLGERVRLPARASLRVGEDGIALADFPLGGPGSSVLIVAGHIGLAGRLALDVGIRQFPIDRIPGVLGTKLPVAGSVSGAVRVVGAPRIPALSGELTLAGISFAGHDLGGGTLALTPEGKGGVHVRGQLVQTIGVDGHLVAKPSGLAGEATLTLAKLPIEPFLPTLPAGLTARGVVSGTAAARIAPDRPAFAEGRLTELALALSSAPDHGRPAGSIDVHAENEIVVRARAGEGLTLGPARLRTSVGTIEVSGEGHGDDLRAAAHGRLELGGLAAFTRPWLDRIAGSIDFDVTASARGTFDDVSLSGGATITEPVSVKLAGQAVEASLPGGRFSLTRNVLDTAALPVIVRAEGFPVAVVQRIDAKARLTARLDGASAKGRFNAHLAVDSVDVHVPLVGHKPIHAAGGLIDVVGETATGKVDLARIDLPITGEAEGLAAAAGVTVDRAKVALRVRGTSRQLALSGDVDLGKAHVKANALKKSVGGGGGASGTGKKGPLANHPEIEAATLDIRVRSGGGAVEVDVNNLPDLRVDIDMHVGGTVKKPSITGTQKGANVWSSFVLALVKLFT